MICHCINCHFALNHKGLQQSLGRFMLWESRVSLEEHQEETVPGSNQRYSGNSLVFPMELTSCWARLTPLDVKSPGTFRLYLPDCNIQHLSCYSESQTPCVTMRIIPGLKVVWQAFLVDH
jgi:hypothetical protein